ncbi:uncharacterized protein LOC107415672 [Ziziphus jujuba]|uniref:Uncharacterized protein LOC107415672 n=1 Tax=Ziziphus jujuba TaxID=326968 RepID=A0A6P4A139_ZIZJJ|nr:uncharacterized protein LOC107415672 [Ziziphus jujuba]
MAMARRAGSRSKTESTITRGVNKVFGFVRAAEFEILCVLFIIITFIIFKDLTSRPEYNQILVKRQDGGFWPY